MPDYPASIAAAAHEAAYVAVDDLLADIALETPQHGNITAKTLRLALRLVADDVLDATAPLFANAVAEKILAHMEEHWPAGCNTTRAPRRHFRIAAQVASRAFTTDAEERQQAAEALAGLTASLLARSAGNYVACDIPGDGVPRDA